MSYGDTPGGNGYTQPVNGTLILVLGILGIVCIPLLAPVAWIMGNGATKVVGAAPDQANLANIGRILGIIGTVLLILAVIGYFVFGAAFLSAAKHSPPMPVPSLISF